jgi:hypothetical protein
LLRQSFKGYSGLVKRMERKKTYLLGSSSVPIVQSMKSFTRARGNSEKSFISFPKEERVDGIKSIHSV